MNFEELALEGKIFKLVSNLAEGDESEENAQSKYYQFHINTQEGYNSRFKVIKISDVTINIKFDLNQGEKRLLELVNACVSHEMRNPINAILGMNMKLT